MLLVVAVSRCLANGAASSSSSLSAAISLPAASTSVTRARRRWSTWIVGIRSGLLCVKGVGRFVVGGGVVVKGFACIIWSGLAMISGTKAKESVKIRVILNQGTMRAWWQVGKEVLTLQSGILRKELICPPAICNELHLLIKYLGDADSTIWHEETRWETTLLLLGRRFRGAAAC